MRQLENIHLMFQQVSSLHGPNLSGHAHEQTHAARSLDSKRAAHGNVGPVTRVLTENGKSRTTENLNPVDLTSLPYDVAKCLIL